MPLFSYFTDRDCAFCLRIGVLVHTELEVIVGYLCVQWVVLRMKITFCNFLFIKYAIYMR